MSKTAVYGILGTVAALWLGLEAGFRIGQNTERGQQQRAMSQIVGSAVRDYARAKGQGRTPYQQGWDACMEQF